MKLKLLCAELRIHEKINNRSLYNVPIILKINGKINSSIIVPRIIIHSLVRTVSSNMMLLDNFNITYTRIFLCNNRVHVMVSCHAVDHQQRNLPLSFINITAFFAFAVRSSVINAYISGYYVIFDHHEATRSLFRP